ncbi:MAG TPA: LPS export ABC transporter permease LptF [Thermodesulfobacteriota bacterium]|nr:LPS export ABC transporter permease LptF [Thermodesulfobacteriota bacterium]
MRKTTYLYILKEVFPIFSIGLMVFTIILLMDKILKLIELIVTRGGNIKNVLMLIAFISPSFLVFTIPTALLLGTLIAFGRLSGDSEITAFKASGMSLYQLFLPVSIFSMVACLLTTFLVYYGLPWGNRGFKATLYLLATSKADVDIKERVFNDLFDGLVVYVDRVPIQGKKMEGILIYDERDKSKHNTIFAKEGTIINNPKMQEVILTLRNGDIHRYDPKADLFQKVQFDSYDLKLELTKAFALIWKKLKDYELSVDEIKDKIETLKKQGEDPTHYEIELHKRYAIPFACIVFGLIGVPLGVQPRRSGKSYGFIFSILILLAYYLSLIFFEGLATRKTVPAFSAGWIPNFLFGGLGIYLLIRATRESPFKPAAWLIDGLDFIQKQWQKVSEDG